MKAPPKSDRPLTRNERRAVDKHNAHRPEFLVEIPREQWPPFADRMTKPPARVMASRFFLVQIFEEPDGVVRLTVNRAQVQADGNWRDGITWDELQAIKCGAGYGDAYAVEVYPRDRDTVCDANMRHLWVLPEPLNVGWFPGSGRPGAH